ncbi:phosphopyruvate hydratase, partial [Candidatus Woesearchaeota archaeon]|nr:phosphopyruvate hydratase [Candidatus Woesearchaeota archaeon]
MSTISSITAREILSSGGTPTVEVKVILSDGSAGIASVPFGASAGSHEAFVLFDGDKGRFQGKGMLKAVEHVNRIIGPGIAGKDPEKQREIDDAMVKMDGTTNMGSLGANAILGVSLAVARAAASAKKLPLYAYLRELFAIPLREYILPNPMMVAIEGGKHADDSTDFQEYLIAPIGGKTIAEEVRAGLEVYFSLKKILKGKGFTVNIGNEGAFAPAGIKNNEDPIRYIIDAIQAAGFTPGKDVGVSFDGACSEIFDGGKYHLGREKKDLTSGDMGAYFKAWVKKYPAIITIEDPLDEDDWGSWTAITEALGNKVMVIADDLTATNPERLQKAIDHKAANAILIKLNQNGTVTGTINTCMLARKHGFSTIVSHRGGGETNDTFMIDLAVAVNSVFVKVGPTRGERVAKYNRLMEI